MDELRDILKSDNVPDPGDEYWRDFGKRVEGSLPPASGKPTAVPGRRLFASLAAAAALLMVAAIGAIFLTVREGSAPAPSNPGGTGVECARTPASGEAERTASLAGTADSAGVLAILQEAAADKTLGAERAFERRDLDALAPLARSYGKLVREGLQPRVTRAAEEGEDLSPWIPALRKALATEASTWKRLSEEAGDEATRRELANAGTASLGLKTVLDDEFPEGRE
jgi:hypothetical protein